MTNDLVTTQSNPDALALVDLGALGSNPAAVYLAGLSKGPAQRVQRHALGVVTDLLTPEQFSPPERPPRPGSKATLEERASYDRAKMTYKAERLAYDNRCLLIPWGDLRFQHTAAIRAQLVSTYPPATANRVLCALRGVLRAAWRLGLMSEEDHARACDVASVTGATLPAGRALGAGEISALMAACENDATSAGTRDAALIALAYSCGLRRAELAGLDLADYDPESGAVKVTGKRNKERLVYLVNGARRAMDDWRSARGDWSGPLFVAINKGGALDHGRMTPQAVYNLLAKRGKAAGVKDFSPHDLRRSFISDLLDAGADIATVARMAGHASVVTTQRYDRRPEEAKQKAAGLLHVPYRGRLVR